MDDKDLLAEWRVAEVRIGSAEPGSEERARAEATAEEARTAYKRRLEELAGVARSPADPTAAITDTEFDWTAAWRRVEAALPEGWHLDSLRCTSTGTRSENRSDAWIAVAADRAGAEIHVRGLTAEAALRDLQDAATRA